MNDIRNCPKSALLIADSVANFRIFTSVIRHNYWMRENAVPICELHENAPGSLF